RSCVYSARSSRCSSLCDLSCLYTARVQIDTLSLHDALPISHRCYRLALDHGRTLAGYFGRRGGPQTRRRTCPVPFHARQRAALRSEEHTSELQSPDHLVCRLLLEKKKKRYKTNTHHGQHHTE